jgi:hypothetical protein
MMIICTISFGCVLDVDGFVASHDAAREPAIAHSEPSFSAMNVVLNLFRILQSLGAVPVIDVNAYVHSLENASAMHRSRTALARANEQLFLAFQQFKRRLKPT